MLAIFRSWPLTPTKRTRRTSCAPASKTTSWVSCPNLERPFTSRSETRFTHWSQETVSAVNMNVWCVSVFSVYLWRVQRGGAVRFTAVTPDARLPLSSLLWDFKGECHQFPTMHLLLISASLLKPNGIMNNFCSVMQRFLLSWWKSNN